MKRSTIIKRLKGLVELSALARSYFTGNAQKLVSLGLLTESEYVEYQAGWSAESKLDLEMRIAEDAIPHPDLQTNPRLPKPYLELAAKFQKLQPLVEDDRVIRDALVNLRDLGYMGLKSIGDQLGLRDLAGRVQFAIKDTEDDFNVEYWKLKESIERKERSGTIVNRIRVEIVDEWNKARKEARVNAESRAMATLRPVIARKKQLERFLTRRREEKLQPIREAIAKTLEAALHKGAK